MANKTIHQLNSITLDASDQLAVYDTSADATGKNSIENVLLTPMSTAILHASTATSVIGAINQYKDRIEDLEEEDFVYADDGETPTGAVDFTSQDDTLNPSSTANFVSVDLLTGSDGWSQRFVKVSQMFKNIRTLISKIGNSSMGTTATTLTGAIAQQVNTINTLNTKTTTKHSATMSTGITGWVDYVQVGYIVIVSIILTNFSTHAASTNIAYNLPTPNRSYTTGLFTSADPALSFTLTDNGYLKTSNSYSSSGSTIRCMFAYMANTVA